MAEAIRIGMIGVGSHAQQVLLPALSQVPALRLVCACTAHEQTAKAVEETLHVKCYVGYEAMLQEADIEGVLVVGGPHEPEITACLNAEKHVFCETIGISTHDGARAIRQLRDQKQKVVEIGFCLRYAPVYQKLKALLVEWRRSDPSERMFVVRYYPYIYHFFNLLLYFNGEVSEILVQGSDNQSIISLKFANGDIGVILSRNFNNMSAPYEMVEVSGMSGILRASNGNHLQFDRLEKSVSNSAPEFQLGLATYEGFHPTFSMPYGNVKQLYLRGYIPELEEFARCIQTGEAPLATVEEAEKTLCIHEASKESRKSGLWVKVAYP